MHTYCLGHVFPDHRKILATQTRCSSALVHLTRQSRDGHGDTHLVGESQCQANVLVHKIEHKARLMLVFQDRIWKMVLMYPCVAAAGPDDLDNLSLIHI